MRFNNYVWGLYKNSTEGKELIDHWLPRDNFPDERFAVTIPDIKALNRLKDSGLEKYIKGNKVNFRQFRYDYFSTRFIFSRENIRDLFSDWTINGITLGQYDIFPADGPEYWLNKIRYLSRVFYDLFPDYFFPYTHECKFRIFRDIFNEFGIPLPNMPKKRELLNRVFYYLDLCDALYEFRKSYDLTPPELCAFLYGFAPAIVEELEDPELPNPSKVWFVGGDRHNFELLEEATTDSVISWQGNVDTRRGDIIVMYCLTPRSYVHSIWRANNDGFADPFFHWYSVVEMSKPIKLDVNVTQKELESNPVWSQNPLVRKNLQGINGYPIGYNEYLELISILKSKGQDIGLLPMIKPTTKLASKDLQNERDVEVRLIEPMLKLIGYDEHDWIRQMPIKMGRGERNFPDYCFGAVSKRGEEIATMILESKFELKTQNELQEAYYQTKSYALRLQAEIFIIASKEGIWIYEQKNRLFKFDDFVHFTWIEVEDPDGLNRLIQALGNHIQRKKH
jgi:hypothetical protein